MLVQTQILKQNPGNGQFKVVESGCQPFSIYLGKGVRGWRILMCWVSTLRAALAVASCQLFSCLGKTLTRTGAKQLCACFARGGESFSLHAGKLPDTFLLTPRVSVCVLGDHSKTFLPAYLTVFRSWSYTCSVVCSYWQQRPCSQNLAWNFACHVPAKQPIAFLSATLLHLLCWWQ